MFLPRYVVSSRKIIHHPSLSCNPKHNHNTQQNNQHELLPPYPPAALPSTSINVATSAMTADLGTATLYGSVALGAGLGQTRGEHDWEGSNPTSNSTSSDPAQNRCYFIEFFGVFQAGFEVGLGVGSFLRVRAQRYTVILILNSILPQFYHKHKSHKEIC
jgi:hypothetical protein